MLDTSVAYLSESLQSLEQIDMRPVVELSYLPKEEQQILYDTMQLEDCTPSHVQAIKMRRFSGEVGYNNDSRKRCVWLLEIKEANMLKLEIKMDEKKIVADRKYQVESIYQALEQAFAKYRLNKTEESDGTLCFVGNGNPKDYGAFGCIITSLKEKAWFMDYVTKWIWYNSDDGENEDDFTVEDVLYHYTKKLSVA